MSFLRATLLLALMLTSGTTLAQSTKPGSAVARAHFQEGLASAQRGELEAALAQFRAAYEIQPHFSVLFNIGQAEATLGRPLEAVSTFERYLKEGGEQVGPERRQGVLELIAANRRLIGQLRVVVAVPERTRVWLDGVELQRDRLASAISLKAGDHTLMHSAGSGFPVSQRVTIAPAGVTEVRIEAPPSTGSQPGQLSISCAVPGVSVEISGGPTLVTPIKDPIIVSAGTLVVRFERPGYQPIERSVQVRSERLTRVDCAQRALPELPPQLRAELRVLTTPGSAEVWVDGQRFSGAPLPAGPHLLRVERDGFLPLSTTLSLVAGQTRQLDARLKPTPARADALARRRTLAYVVGGASAALLLASGGLFLWNNQRYEEFERLKATSTPTRNLDFATSIQRVDDLALGLLIGGAIGGGVSGWTFYSSQAD